jgi:GDPmannose 4,6-dehydratase
VVIDPQLIRPAEIAANRGDPAKAGRLLGWKPRHFMPDVVQFMVEAERSNTAC